MVCPWTGSQRPESGFCEECQLEKLDIFGLIVTRDARWRDWLVRGRQRWAGGIEFRVPMFRKSLLDNDLTHDLR